MNNDEKLKNISRELNDDLGGLFMQIQALEGVREFLYDISNELDTTAYRGNATYTEKKLNLKINAIYELVNYSLHELSEHEKEASKQSAKIIDLFTSKNNIDKKTKSSGGDI